MNIETSLSCIQLSNNVKLYGIENINTNIKKHNLVYKIVNTINSKFYIGKHTTNNPYDLYMGSGKLLQLAKNKYGISSFSKTILFDFENEIDMKNKEEELMPIISCNFFNKQCYNLVKGGGGGWKYANGVNIAKGKKHSSNIKHIEAAKKRVHTDEERKKQSEKMKGRKRSQHAILCTAIKNKGKKRNLEQRQKISKALKGRKIKQSSIDKCKQTKIKNGTTGKGSSNSMFGTRVLISPTKEKIRVKIAEVEYFLKLGYKYSNPKWYKI